MLGYSVFHFGYGDRFLLILKEIYVDLSSRKMVIIILSD